tara:strand:- start:315 stop:908 length:594 start_codon:yes stop_codon:yes gene_type:complete
MRANEKLNSIKTLLGIPITETKQVKVELETMKLENGTDIEADSFEKGKEVFILTDDERVAMPVGEYILEDSRLLVVEEEGLIADVREVSDEVPEKEETTEDLEDGEDEEKKMADVGDWEGMEKRMQNLEDAIADLKGKVDAEKDEYSSELKEELSMPAAQAIKHSPEAVTGKTEMIPYSKNRSKTVMDSVLSKILNN